MECPPGRATPFRPVQIKTVKQSLAFSSMVSAVDLAIPESFLSGQWVRWSYGTVFTLHQNHSQFSQVLTRKLVN